jgi:hypothetical protein
MKYGPFKMAAKSVILICFAVFVVLPVVVVGTWHIMDSPYHRLFSSRNQTYHAQVAQACDELLAQAEPMPREIRRDGLRSLPPVLRDLNPDYVMIETNLVMVVITGGLCHKIIWAPEQLNSSWWNLKTYVRDDREGRILFSKMKPGAANHSMQRTEASRSGQSAFVAQRRLASAADAERSA